MARTLRIPNETRFVRAFALASDSGDTLSLLLEVGALGSRDLGIVRRTREALDSAYDRASNGPLPASNGKDWEQTHTVGVLREALIQPDSAAYLAYYCSNRQTEHIAAGYVEILAVVGCAADSLSVRRRPWEVEANDLSLPEWRKRVWKLLFAMPGNALLRPARPPAAATAPCTCSEPGSLTTVAGDHTPWCPACCVEEEAS